MLSNHRSVIKRIFWIFGILVCEGVIGICVCIFRFTKMCENIDRLRSATWDWEDTFWIVCCCPWFCMRFMSSVAFYLLGLFCKPARIDIKFNVLINICIFDVIEPYDLKLIIIILYSLFLYYNVWNPNYNIQSEWFWMQIRIKQNTQFNSSTEQLQTIWIESELSKFAFCRSANNSIYQVRNRVDLIMSVHVRMFRHLSISLARIESTRT